MLEADYLILRGPMGVGKSTTGRALFKRLHQLEVPRACLPFDLMRKFISDRQPSYQNKLLHTENTIYLANSYLDQGYFTIIEGVFAIQEFVDKLKTEISGEYKLIRLTCPPETCYQRDLDRKFICGTENIDCAYRFYEQNLNYNREEIIIDNHDKTVDLVVDQIISELFS